MALDDDSGRARTLHAHLIDSLGCRIVDGSLNCGQILSIDELAVSFGVSRPVVREAIGVLGSLGLVESRRRRGTEVLPAERWSSLSPQVIRWRFEDPRQRSGQFRCLLELRQAVEPPAAALACQRRDELEATRLQDLAGRMSSAGRAEQLDAFRSLDLEFHRVLLRMSGNQMFADLSGVVDEIIHAKHRFNLIPPRPDSRAMWLHVELADAVSRGEPLVAQAADRELVEQSGAELMAVLDSY